jgi:hypothetical protein
MNSLRHPRSIHSATPCSSSYISRHKPVVFDPEFIEHTPKVMCARYASLTESPNICTPFSCLQSTTASTVPPKLPSSQRALKCDVPAHLDPVLYSEVNDFVLRNQTSTLRTVQAHLHGVSRRKLQFCFQQLCDDHILERYKGR